MVEVEKNTKPKAKAKAKAKAKPKAAPVKNAPVEVAPVKAVTSVEVASVKVVTPKAKLKKYKGMYQSVGKRKSAVARVRFSDKLEKKEIIVNGKPMNEYFNSAMWQKTILAPLDLLGFLDKVYISAKVHGGGPMGQAEAIRHGISKILVGMDEAHRKPLKALGFLTRDPRVKERKKPGLKRARRAPQWSKR